MSIEDANYYGDRRVRARNRREWYTRLDENRMQATVVIEDEEGDEAEHLIPFKFVVCDTCDGKGKHVNPSVDSNGLTADDFDQDPDFKEDYFGGLYDVTCYGCGGRRVVPVIDEENADADLLRRLREQEEHREEYARIRRAERRYGA